MTWLTLLEMSNEHSLTNTDYINNNCQEKEEGKDVDQDTLSRMNIEASKSETELLKSSSPKGNEDNKNLQSKESLIG